MDTKALARLGHYIVGRRVALGYKQRVDLANALDLTDRTLADIEHGKRLSSAQTYAMIENRLGWKPGSVSAIIDGGEPTTTDSAPEPEPDLTEVPTPKLVAELGRRFPVDSANTDTAAHGAVTTHQRTPKLHVQQDKPGI